MWSGPRTNSNCVAFQPFDREYYACWRFAEVRLFPFASKPNCLISPDNNKTETSSLFSQLKRNWRGIICTSCLKHMYVLHFFWKPMTNMIMAKLRWQCLTITRVWITGYFTPLIHKCFKSTCFTSFNAGDWCVPGTGRFLSPDPAMGRLAGGCPGVHMPTVQNGLEPGQKSSVRGSLEEPLFPLCWTFFSFSDLWSVLQIEKLSPHMKLVISTLSGRLSGWFNFYWWIGVTNCSSGWHYLVMP